MRYLIDFLVGLLGMLVGSLIWELGKREWEALTTRKSFAEVVRDLTKDLKRPPSKAQLRTGRKYSVQETLLMARNEKSAVPMSTAEIMAAARRKQK